MKDIHSSMIMEALEAEILSGAISPGARLNEQTLAERFGVSRTPVREALQMVVSRSLADRVPYKGVIVRHLEEDRVLGMFEAMAEIEAVCGGLAATRMSNDGLATLKRLHFDLSDLAGNNASREYEAANSRFHALIYQSCGNEDLAQMAFEMRLKLAPFRKSQLFQRERMAQSNREHALIVDLIALGNRPGVEHALRAHLGNASRAFFHRRDTPYVSDR